MFHTILHALNSPLFVVGTDHVTSAEILGFLTGAITVYLIVKEKVANFPVGIANNIFFFILFANAALFADAWLQVVYVVLAVIGWVAWLKAGPKRTELHVTKANWWQLVLAIGFAAGFTVFFTPILRGINDIAPFWDSLSTGLSLSATGLLTWKKLQNWYFWIAADCIYIPLYFAKSLYLTGIVYVIFMSLCFMGLKLWRDSYHKKQEQVATTKYWDGIYAEGGL